MQARRSNHSVYRVQYHIVWVTKYRRKLFNPGLKDHLKRLLYKATRSMPGVEIQEVNVQREHIHMMAVIPPKYAVSNVVGKLKSKSSSIFRDRYRLFKKVYGEKEIMWSPGYFVSTVGIDEHAIQRYIKYQGDLDSGQMKFDL
ncbi:IS200/IS605 family transposase [Candidatus Omnitrophota bacterium]